MGAAGAKLRHALVTRGGALGSRWGLVRRGLPAGEHAPGALGSRGGLVRRGPPAGERAPVDLAFRVAAGGVILAAAVLGVAMGLAQPSWLLAAALVAGGALIAAVVALSAHRHDAEARS